MSIKIDVVHNGGQWTHREWRALRDLGATTKIIPNTTPPKKVDALAFSVRKPARESASP